MSKKGTCDYCGEELPAEDLIGINGDLYCIDCKPVDVVDDDEQEICSSCNGSGEGMYDGTRCGSCKGSGTVA